MTSNPGTNHKLLQTIRDLHAERNCTPWIHDLLDLVEEHMLVVLSEGHTRKSSKELLGALKEMDRKGRKSQGYFVSKRPRQQPAGWRPQVGTLARLNEAARRPVANKRVVLPLHKPDGRPLRLSQLPED